jgi:hypothetical protein
VLVLIGIAFGCTDAARAAIAVTTAQVRLGRSAKVSRSCGSPVVLGCMTLDMFAVIFGGATTPPTPKTSRFGAGYGLLTSSPSSARDDGAHPGSGCEGAGRTLAAVACHGVAPTFGLSRSVPLSIAWPRHG